MKVIDNREFVRTWMHATSNKLGTREVAKKLDMTTGSVYAKASNLRKRGVKLPTMAFPMQSDDVEALNKMIVKLQRGGK